MGRVLFLFFFNRSIQYGCLFFNNFFVFVFKCLFVSVYHTLSSGGEKEDYIMCELIGGESLRLLNTIYNLFIGAVHYTHINTCCCCCWYC